MTSTKLFRLYSHFNFTPAQWREAAQRYLLLEAAIEKYEEEDGEVDHDSLTDNFERCQICEDIQELQNDREEFAIAFAEIWAKQAIAR